MRQWQSCWLHCGQQTDTQRHPDVPNQHAERRRAILDFEVILQFRSRSISLFLWFNICYQQHWICWQQPDRKGLTTGYEPKCLHPSASSTQRVPCAFVLWVTHQLKQECPHSKVLEVRTFYPCCFRCLCNIFKSSSRSIKKSFQVEWEVCRIDCFPIVFIAHCVENAAWIRIQCIVPLPDISHALGKQFLDGHCDGDTFTGFHYLFSSGDVLRSLTTCFHFTSYFKFWPFKWPSSDRSGASSWHAD